MPEHSVMAIIMATRLEAGPFIPALALEEDVGTSFPVFRGRHWVLVVSGMGKANAAMATAWACMRFQPRMIFNLGASGALQKDLTLYGIHHIERVVEPDRPDLQTGRPQVHQPRLLEGFDTRVLATHDRPVKSSEERLAAAEHADLCDMEGAAVVQAAEKFQVPCVLFKFVSDTPALDEQGHIAEQILRFRHSFCGFFLKKVLPKL